MAQDAQCGVMLWDGKSKGTLNNIQELLSAGKKTLVYFAPENLPQALLQPAIGGTVAAMQSSSNSRSTTTNQNQDSGRWPASPARAAP
jgi:hypothetical protein